MNETNEKIALLRETGSDWEWYPTTDEILTEMNRDLYDLFKSHCLEKVMQRSKKYERLFDSVPEYKDGRVRVSDKPYCWHFCIDSFLDVGTGDGR